MKMNGYKRMGPTLVCILLLGSFANGYELDLRTGVDFRYANGTSFLSIGVDDPPIDFMGIFDDLQMFLYLLGVATSVEGIQILPLEFIVAKEVPVGPGFILYRFSVGGRYSLSLNLNAPPNHFLGGAVCASVSFPTPKVTVVAEVGYSDFLAFNSLLSGFLRERGGYLRVRGVFDIRR